MQIQRKPQTLQIFHGDQRLSTADGPKVKKEIIGKTP